MGETAVPFLLGALSGALGGLMGVGGGIILVPLLVHVLHRGQHEAQGISLAFIVATSLVAAATYYGQARVDVPLACWLMLGAVPGVILGARIAALSPAGRLRVGFGILVIATAVRLLASPPGIAAGGATAGAVPWPAVWNILVGLVVGLVAGLLGVGGGTILVPILVLAQHVEQHIAQGTSLLMILPVGVVGFLIYARQRRLDRRGLPSLLLGGALGAFGGATLAHRIQAPMLSRLFAVFLIGVGAQMILRKPSGLASPSSATVGGTR